MNAGQLMITDHLYNTIFTIEGHYMASRLSRSITTQSRKLRSLLTEYNATVSSVEQLSWEDVTDLTSSLWLTSHRNDFLVPRSVRITGINILMKSKRAVEELQLLKSEMHNVLKFHIEQHTALVDAILQLQAVPSEFNRGAVCLLKIRKYHCERELKACSKSFSHLIPIPEISFSLEEVHYEFDTAEDGVCFSLPESNNNVNYNFTDGIDSDGVANVVNSNSGGISLSDNEDDNNDSFVGNIDLDDNIDADVDDDDDIDTDVDDDIDADLDGHDTDVDVDMHDIFDDNLNGKLDHNLDDHDDNDNDYDYNYDTEISKL